MEEFLIYTNFVLLLRMLAKDPTGRKEKKTYFPKA